MEFCLTARMRGKAEEKYSVFLFLVGEQGRDVLNTINWKKKKMLRVIQQMKMTI